jgi:signal peptidase I
VARKRGRHAKPERPLYVELPVLLIVALTVAVVIKSFLIQPFYIPSESMLPTIHVNDRVMVSKLSYRLGDIERGDIVVFKSPFDDAENGESIPQAVLRHVLEALGIRAASAEDFIKRVVAVGGDQIEISGNQLLINGNVVDEPYLPAGTTLRDMEAQTVPAQQVFVMGDNRPQSYDSTRFGPIPEEDIVGEAILRIWPVSRFGSVDSVGSDS